MEPREYYKDKNIRLRMAEYMGGDSPLNATAVYIGRCGTPDCGQFSMRAPARLYDCLDEELEVGRSLWDRRSMIAHLDIEYVNFDFPAEPYLDPVRMFALQRPVEDAILGILAEYGLRPLHLISGRGHHFVWRVERDSQAFVRLCEIGVVPGHVLARYRQPHPPLNESVDDDTARAFSGLGLLMEYLAYLIKERAAPRSMLPVELTAVEAGPVERGREVISIDISEYGDPLYTRIIRIPFSRYRKPHQESVIPHSWSVERIPELCVVPLAGRSITEALATMRDRSKAVELAASVSTRIPDFSEQTERLIESYRCSDVKRFHDFFYSQDHQSPHAWSYTYDRTPVHMVPSCVRHILDHPNDLLLKPSGIQLVTRCFLALGWHPRHISGFIRSKYERDYGWAWRWFTYDATLRADFYTRIFSGLFITGRDDLIDFNCVSTREKGICRDSGGMCSIDAFRDSLLQRRSDGRLASRPFNRLLLPAELI
jgi:hypothetical protein